MRSPIDRPAKPGPVSRDDDLAQPGARGPSLGLTVDAVVGGLIISQALTLYTTPVIYLFMEQLSQRLRGHGKTTRIPAGA